MRSCISYILKKNSKESGERWASLGDQPVQACPAVLTCPYTPAGPEVSSWQKVAVGTTRSEGFAVTLGPQSDGHFSP